MPDRAEVDFDHHSPEYAAHHREILRDLQQRCPVAWTDAHDGYWVVTDYENVATVSRDDDRFASRKDPDPDGTYQGTSIPTHPGLAVPIETDPPEFHFFRRLLNPVFSPAAIARIEPMIRSVAAALIDRVIETGTFDVVVDLTNPLPAIMTMHIIGLPLQDWPKYAMPMHALLYTPPGPQQRKVAAEFREMIASMLETLAQRRDEPKDDFLSYLAHAEAEGRRLSDEDIDHIVGLVITGGVDTTTAVTSNALVYLSAHPDARQLLIDEPERRQQACEEFLRYFSPVQALARTVTTDTELADQRLRAGDRVLVSWAGANQDQSIFDRPDEVVLDRFPNRHTAFGLGLHRCVGSNLARSQLLTMIDAVLDRIPDYHVIEDKIERYPSLAVINGVICAPAVFTPGPKVGSSFAL